VVRVVPEPVDQSRILHGGGDVRGDRLQQADVVGAEAGASRTDAPGDFQGADHGGTGTQRYDDRVLDGVRADQRPQGRIAQLGANRDGLPGLHGAGTQRLRGAVQVDEAVGLRAGGQQRLWVPALRGQPEGRVVGLHQLTHPGEQHVRQRGFGAGFADGAGQVVDLAERFVLAQEVGVRPVHQHEHAGEDRQQQRRPWTAPDGQQDDQPDAGVDHSDRQAGRRGPDHPPERHAALYQRDHQDDATRVEQQAHRGRREQDQPGVRIGLVQGPEPGHDQRAGGGVGRAVRRVEGQLHRRHPTPEMDDQHRDDADEQNRQRRQIEQREQHGYLGQRDDHAVPAHFEIQRSGIRRREERKIEQS
jgi:hypothetical protein